MKTIKNKEGEIWTLEDKLSIDLQSSAVDHLATSFNYIRIVGIAPTSIIYQTITLLLSYTLNIYYTLTKNLYK